MSGEEKKSVRQYAKKHTKKHWGILDRLRAAFERNRLGKLMVIKGLLEPGELRYALARQKHSGGHLGCVLVSEKLISRRALYSSLAEQWTMRFMVAGVAVFLAFSSLGIRPARAGAIKDIPAQVRLTSAANKVFAPMYKFPALFGANERRSTNIGPFTKWTDMFNRFEVAMRDSTGQKIMRAWQSDLQAYQSLPLEQMAEKVNNLVNEQRYILDSNNWGKSDYWATPVEFYTRGGDCEDFAIAKYAALRALGVPEERLRIAIVHDNVKDIPHAVLIVYTNNDSLMLDSQLKQMKSTRSVDRYRPIFSINRQAWWLHTKPDSTVIALAE